MAQRKRNSVALTKAERRVAGLQAIDPNLDLGNRLSIITYKSMINELREKLAAYNQARVMMEMAKNALKEAEVVLNSYSEHMLLGVACRYGKDSHQYEMAGGKRRSKRRTTRSVTKKPTVSVE
ncbi:hypothetical protein BLD44_025600 [Mastigocladus laminosus UU774]|nr:hypothetical protein BLD44_025600 [Mastigocladus laminosus UU774]